jgi:type IV pilus assembly protein PilO
MTAGTFMNDGFDTPSYPTAFGISFTPKVIGILAGLGGIALAGYIGTQLISPQLEQAKTLQGNITQLETDLQQKQETVQRLNQLVASLNQAKAKHAEVRSLFSDQQALDTLLIDLNRVITASKAKLLNFAPDYGASGVVADGSLGPELNSKLKRQVTAVSFQGSFDQTLAIMQSIDRLQTVLVIQDLSMELNPPDKEGSGTVETITSKFKLYAYVPLSLEEVKAAQAAQPPAAPAKETPQ